MSLFSNNAGGSGGFGAFGAANNNNQQAGNPSVFGSGGAFGQPAAAAPGTLFYSLDCFHVLCTAREIS